MSWKSHLRSAGFCIIAALAICLPAASSRAAVVTLGAPTSEVAAGGIVRVELLILNFAAQSLAYTLPTQLDGRLTKEGRVWLTYDGVNIRRGQARCYLCPPALLNAIRRTV